MDSKKMKIRSIISVAILAMFFILYNICFWIFTAVFTMFSGGVGFWTSYVMMLFVFVVVGATFVVNLLTKSEPKDAFLRFPIYVHSIVYFVLALIATSLFMIVDLYVFRIWFISIPVNLIMLTLHIVILVSAFFVKNHIKNLDDKVKDKTNFVRLLKVDVDVIAETAVDPAVREAYISLSDQVKYSDPMSHESLFELEKQILECMSFAKRCVEQGKNDAAIQNCQIASRMLFERNEKVKVLK